ncbi:hypothetical protein BDV28DRAFT_150497 [Aspergillus coremiiformis]|uniref:Uncharacterized protein n=1 Tax=Aspergillus coremiiformis TaxID=138285 RepID=A0A5N6Z4H3_9EURO|nr:hypothetical protein BDV28DRAFT_150497 [Aspergillus coremiiformis]
MPPLWPPPLAVVPSPSNPTQWPSLVQLASLFTENGRRCDLHRASALSITPTLGFVYGDCNSAAFNIAAPLPSSNLNASSVNVVSDSSSSIPVVASSSSVPATPMADPENIPENSYIGHSSRHFDSYRERLRHGHHSLQ